MIELERYGMDTVLHPFTMLVEYWYSYPLDNVNAPRGRVSNVDKNTTCKTDKRGNDCQNYEYNVLYSIALLLTVVSSSLLSYSWRTRGGGPQSSGHGRDAQRRLRRPRRANLVGFSPASRIPSTVRRYVRIIRWSRL